MKKKILYIPMLFALMLATSSCEDNKGQYLDDYKTILYFTNNTETPLTLYKTGTDTEYKVNVFKAGSDLEASTEVHVDLMNSAELTIYNETNGKSYKALPTNCYSLAESSLLTFDGIENSKSVNVTFKTDEIGKLAEGFDYVLPLKLVDSPDSINSKKNVVFLKPNVVTPKVSFETSGLKQLSIKSLEGQTKFTLPVSLPFDNQWDFNCTISVDNEALATYNKANNTSYVLLPAEAYSLNPKVDFKKGTSSVSTEIVIENSKLGYKEYVLPLKLSSCSMPTFEIDQTKNVCLLQMGVPLDKIALTTGMLSTNAQEPSEGAIAGLIDGNVNTYFHTSWSTTVENPPHYFQIALNTPITAFKFQYTTRFSNGNAAPQTIDLMVSNDGTTFSSVQVISSGLPTGGNASYTSPIIDAGQTFKYLRIAVPKSVAGENTFFVMSEFSLYGK